MSKDLVGNIEHLIPVMGEEYYHTEFEGMSDFDLIEKAMRFGFNIKFQGPTGAGKTTTFVAFCAHHKVPNIVTNMKGGTTTEELIGAWAPAEGSTGFVWKDGLITRAVRYSQMFDEVTITKGAAIPPLVHTDTNGNVVPDDIISKKGDTMVVKQYKPIMLTIEEINFSPEELMSVWFSLLDARRNIVLGEKNGEVLKAGKNLIVTATMNPDYVGTNKLNRALEDRFTIKLNVTYDKRVENKIIQEMAMKYKIAVDDVKFLVKFIQQVRQAKANESISCDISTRMIRAYLQISGAVSKQVAYACLMNSFDEMDRDAIKSIIDLVRKDKVNLDMSSPEVEGLDFTKFEGYKEPVPVATPKPASVATPKKTPGNAVRAPF